MGKGDEKVKEEVDKVIEDEITEKLSEDLLQSIEKKFQADLQKSVDMVLIKIKLLLENGTTHIQEGLLKLQGQLESLRNLSVVGVDHCLLEKQNLTNSLAEKALHQMVVCGYALIGHDPAQAVQSVINLKAIIKEGLKPIHTQKKEVDSLLKVCGHEHDTLKKVIKCVISKSPIIKSAMMEVTSKMIEGVVDLTKLMAHGAMHEACLIEVLRTVEEEAFTIVNSIKHCVKTNSTDANFELEMKSFLEKDNATQIDVVDVKKEVHEMKIDPNKEEVKEMKSLLRRMLSDDKDLDKKFKKKLKKLQKDLEPTNLITEDAN